MDPYKPLGSGLHVYFKVKSDEDPEDFDKKDYVLMSQETPSSVFSLTEGDTKELVFKTKNESITYTSSNVTYEKFKTFLIRR